METNLQHQQAAFSIAVAPWWRCWWGPWDQSQEKVAGMIDVF
jgi:hypothetical protein